MPELVNLLRRVVIALGLVAASATTAAAQTTGSATAAVQTPGSTEQTTRKIDALTRFDFHLSASALSSDDPRFKWDTHFGGDLDLVDYAIGRLSFLGDYEAVLGNEFRPFDPNQGNYTLEGSASARTSVAEVALVFHHVSRHLSDRPKRLSVDWNVLGLRALRQVAIGPATLEARVSVGKVLKHSYADYTWMGDADVMARRPISPQFGLFLHGATDFALVDGTVPDRGTQVGGLAEAGVRLSGRGAALELFASYERRIDADPLDRQPQRWFSGGFRFLSK